jgi:hypothetical protein
MSTTLEFPAELFPDKNFDGPVTLTYSGASPTDVGPAGRVMDMIIAQTVGDRDALARVVTPQSLEMCKVEPPGRQLVAELGETTYEGDDQSTAIVQGKVSADGNETQMAFVVVKQPDGRWLVDMSATIDRLMGGSMEALMKGMGEAMGQAMGALGEGMAKAFGGALGATDVSSEQGGAMPVEQPEDTTPNDPPLPEFERWLADRFGVNWKVNATSIHMNNGVHSFLGLSPAQADKMLGELREAIEEGVRDDPALPSHMRNIHELLLAREPDGVGFHLDPSDRRAVYAIGQNSSGEPVFLGVDGLREFFLPMFAFYAETLAKGPPAE